MLRRRAGFFDSGSNLTEVKPLIIVTRLSSLEPSFCPQVHQIGTVANRMSLAVPRYATMARRWIVRCSSRSGLAQRSGKLDGAFPVLQPSLQLSFLYGQ